MILAAFFDPSNDGFDMADAAMIAGFAVGPSIIILGWLRIAGRKWMTSIIEPIVVKHVDERTSSIQANANGGKSLPDVNRKVDLIATHLGIDLPENLQVRD